LRYFLCGEYGSKLKRPHFHAIIYGYDFPDKVHYSTNGLKQKLYISETLSKLWGKGFASVGGVTPESCQYVARYVLKKQYGEMSVEHYGDKKPEFITMSRRPGIGARWLEAFQADIYPQGVLVFNGHKQMPPKYYDSVFSKHDPDRMEEIKEERQRAARRVSVYDMVRGAYRKVDNNDSFRLAVREKVVELRMKNLKRFMEELGQ